MGGPTCACQEELIRFHGYACGLIIRATRQHFDTLGRPEVVKRSREDDFASAVYLKTGCTGSLDATDWQNQARRNRQIEVLPEVIQRITASWCFWSIDLVCGVADRAHPGCLFEKYDNPSEFVWIRHDQVMDVNTLYRCTCLASSRRATRASRTLTSSGP